MPRSKQGNGPGQGLRRPSTRGDASSKGTAGGRTGRRDTGVGQDDTCHPDGRPRASLGRGGGSSDIRVSYTDKMGPGKGPGRRRNQVGYMTEGGGRQYGRLRQLRNELRAV
eukprot:378913-Pyramimonas_sp.AAC.1